MQIDLSQFRSGDVIGFSGADLMSDVVNVATLGWPRWGLSHVGIVMVDPENWSKLLWESTSQSRSPCWFQKRVVSGVQAHELGARLAEHRGRIWLYPLVESLRTIPWAHLGFWCRRQLGTPYDLAGAIAARELCCGWLWHRLLPEDTARVFCSEFVPAALREVGRWPSDANCSRYSPNRLVRLLRREAIVGPGVRIK